MSMPAEGATPDASEGSATESDDQAAEQLLAEAATADGDTAGSHAEGDAALGDPGKKALAKLREQVKAERDARRAAEKRLADVEQVDEATKKQREAEAEALAKANDRILKAEVRTAAKGVLADPADAFRFLSLDDFDVSPDGEVDTGQLAQALADLVREKPYLGAKGTDAFRDSGDGGARGKSSVRGQLTAADLDSMSMAEINEARRAGRLDVALGKTP
ncbi:hypothetical protein ACPCTH_33540 [Streptomyces cellulosae]